MNTTTTKKRFFPVWTGMMFGIALSLLFLACPTSNDNNTSGGDSFTTFAGTYWTDKLQPESTIAFTTYMVTLAGRYWDGLYYEGKDRDGIEGTYSFAQAADFSAAEVEPAVQIFTAGSKGIELYYYKAANGKPERVIVYGYGQPRAFYQQ